LWCALVGLPDFGVEAASQAGVKLERVVLVPQPEAQWLSVVAALSAALPVVVVRPSTPVRQGEAARLATRLRDSETVLLVVGEWPGAEATISLTGPQWLGVGDGWGCLTKCEANLMVHSKRYPAGRSVRVVLPGSEGILEPAAGWGQGTPERTVLRMVA
jgi:hypothetical protein